MARYSVLLRSDESTLARAAGGYESEEEVYVGDLIDLGGVRVLVDDIAASHDGTPVLECRRLWKLRLVDVAGEPVGRGFILNEQRHYGDVEILVLEPEARFRVLRVEPTWPDGFDGAFVVERLPE